MLKDRLLTTLALFFAAGIAVAFGVTAAERTVCFWVSLALCILSVWWFFFTKKKVPDWHTPSWYLLFVLIGVTAGIFWAGVREAPYASYDRFVKKTDTVTGVVTDSGTSETAAYFVLQTDASKQGVPDGTKVRLYCTRNVRVTAGDEVTAEVFYSGAPDVSGKGDGILLVGNGKLTELRHSDTLFGKLRRKLLAYSEKLFAPTGQQGIVEALLFRERSAVRDEVNAAYRNAGLSHLLAISGLHLVVLMTVLRVLLSVFALSKKTGDILTMLFSVFYALLVGGTPSVWRAVLMMAIVTVCDWFFVSADRISALSAAFLLFLIANPYSLFSTGLQLSFLACLGILTVTPAFGTVLEQKDVPLPKRLWSAAVEGLAVSFAAVVFTFPVTALRFGGFSYLSPFLNLLVLPLFPFVLTLLLLSVLCCPLWLFLAKTLAFLPTGFLFLLERCLLFLEEKGIGTFALPEETLWVPELFALCALFGFAFLNKRRLQVTVTSSVCFVCSIALIALFGM